MMTRNDSLFGAVRHIQITAAEHFGNGMTEMTDTSMTGYGERNFLSGKRAPKNCATRMQIRASSCTNSCTAD
jgi:hypothetical protein